MRIFFLTLWCLMAAGITAGAKQMQRKQLLNHDWQFCQGDSNFTKSQTVTLPHDWSVSISTPDTHT